MLMTPVITPHGLLVLRPSEGALAIEPARAARLASAFDRGPGHGLLHLGADEVGTALPAALSYWRDLGARYVTALCAVPGIGESTAKPPVTVPAEDELARIAAAVPPVTGSEYVTAEVLATLWRLLDAAFDTELREAGLSVQEFLKVRHPAWNLVGRVHFNLAENRNDEEAPFAFIATYTTRLSAAAKAQHLPLGKALQEFGWAKNRKALLSLLIPVQRAAERCAWLKTMVDAGEIFHPLRWTPQEALTFLKDVPALESAGVIVRMPANWRMNRPARPIVKATVGGKVPSTLGMDALLDFRIEVTLDGASLTRAEVKRLLAQSEGLVLIRGTWVEIDREKLTQTLTRFEAVERRAGAAGLSFGEAMRMLAGAEIATNGSESAADISWSEIVAGPWLSETLAAMRGSDGRPRANPGQSLQGTLRPYQQAGLQWLHLLTRLRLGACLADDMGLGKTIQVLSLLLMLKSEAAKPPRPSLLVAPASLLANWAGEIARFAPSLKAVVVHPSGAVTAEAANDAVSAADLAITSYGYLARVPLFCTTHWRLVIIDEAQAIKNPSAKQTRTVKQLRGEARIALTGTPIENRLGDLWSIFDFINPGLLGTSKQFSTFVKRPRRASAQSLRSAARSCAALHHAAPQDR